MLDAMEIRDATAADWPSIWPFFDEIVQAGETYAYDPAMDGDAARALWLDGNARTTVATTTDGTSRILGSAAMGANRPGRGAHIATASFMVDKSARGQGVGRALATDVIAWATAAGFHAIQFNAVVETNHAAVALWRSLGFEVVGTVPGAFDHPTHGYVGLHVMLKRLDRPDTALPPSGR
ncbi:GNAT family N-acetyltransferase [Baekduia sp. Peel2402]|uniref:GNAT family N-acetyltransferase n=1 Tax=Baekduia sp. Peel2402 TaxID=3458296 RepID=UPI00403EEEB3